MDNYTAKKASEENFNLEHDVVKLPSEGKFYANKKSSVKCGYLTAQDEDLLASGAPDVLNTLLRNKVYESDIRIEDLLECDRIALLVFLRTTAFGPNLDVSITYKPTKGPDVGKTVEFDYSYDLTHIKTKEPELIPDENNLFNIKLPVSGYEVKCKILTIGEIDEFEAYLEEFKNTVKPVVTGRLSRQVVSINGNSDNIYDNIRKLKMGDSKFLRAQLKKCEPTLDLERQIKTPSGEIITRKIPLLGTEFFRPFF